MFCRRNFFALTTLLLASLGIVACGGGTDPAVEQEQANAEEWSWLQETKSNLDAKRAELAELKATPAEEEGEDAMAGDEGAAAEDMADQEEAGEPQPTREERIATLASEIEALGKDFNDRLATFINGQDIYEGEPLTDIQRQAFNMKADEDILVAKEYIEKGGDYQRAIDIYNNGLQFDPENTKLMAAKEEAESMRYMTEERFAEIKKGMSEDEVRETLGTPMRQNVRDFENNVVGWFYPKEEPNTAAGVFFQEKKGERTVYKADFDAVKANTGEGDG